MNAPPWFNALLQLWVFGLGAVVGSFLNVVIHRLPLGLSVHQPKRSFCPKCQKQLAARDNLPILSWLLLRGRCRYCQAAISPRYLLVEALCGLLFLAVFWQGQGEISLWWNWVPLVVAQWVLLALLLAGSFIDAEHYILPHEITLGGTALGLLSSALVPQLMNREIWWQALLQSLGSAAAAMGGLWLVVELGKLVFGRRRLRFDPAVDCLVSQPDEQEQPRMLLDGEVTLWDEMFSRQSDRLQLHCLQCRVNAEEVGACEVVLAAAGLECRSGPQTGRRWALEEVASLEAKVSEVVIPREAMGFGDVLWLMMIGSFLGWQAVLFTVFAASILGTLVAGGSRLLAGEASWGQKLPFGPYLAAGALIWLFCGPELWRGYLSLMTR